MVGPGAAATTDLTAVVPLEGDPADAPAAGDEPFISIGSVGDLLVEFDPR